MEKCNGTCESCRIKAYEFNCGFCKSPFVGKGYKGFWCQEACYRLNKVIEWEEFEERVLPDRERLERVYGAETPEFAY